MNWFAQHSLAIQAFSALAIAFLTIVLILITRRYVQATQRMVRVMERDSAIRLQPRITPSIKYEWEGQLVKGTFCLLNPGPNDAVIRRVELDYYCSHAEFCERPPKEYPLFAYRVIPVNEFIKCDFQLSPSKETLYHERHAGDCHWIFKVRVACADILGLLVHHYNFDEALGIHHYVQHRLPTLGWLRRKTRLLEQRLRNYRYRMRAWLAKLLRKATS